jgi:hypothetical protein
MKLQVGFFIQYKRFAPAASLFTAFFARGDRRRVCTTAAKGLAALPDGGMIFHGHHGGEGSRRPFTLLGKPPPPPPNKYNALFGKKGVANAHATFFVTFNDFAGTPMQGWCNRPVRRRTATNLRNMVTARLSSAHDGGEGSRRHTVIGRFLHGHHGADGAAPSRGIAHLPQGTTAAKGLAALPDGGIFSRCSGKFFDSRFDKAEKAVYLIDYTVFSIVCDFRRALIVK